jgi:hypothetical protein
MRNRLAAAKVLGQDAALCNAGKRRRSFINESHYDKMKREMLIQHYQTVTITIENKKA